jgi:DNA-binding NarL/FixJ family response regulator
MIRVGIRGDSAMIRAGLRALVGNDPDLEIVEDYEDCDVLLLSGTPGLGSSPFLELPLSGPVPSVLVIADDIDPYRSVLAAAQSGFGLLPANTAEEEVGAAIRALAAGLLAGSPQLMRDLFSGAGRGAGRVAGVSQDLQELSRQELSPREAEVLQLLSLGLVNKEIAARLEISEHTVKYHVSSIFAKLEATNRVEAIREGIRRGLLEL